MFTANEVPLSFMTLPVELVYRVFDHLNDFELFCFTHDICQRLNTIVDTYNRNQVSSAITIQAKSFHFITHY